MTSLLLRVLCAGIGMRIVSLTTEHVGTTRSQTAYIYLFTRDIILYLYFNLTIFLLVPGVKFTVGIIVLTHGASVQPKHYNIMVNS